MTYFQYIIEKNVLCPSCTRILYWQAFYPSISLPLSLYPLHSLGVSLFTVNNMQTALNNGPREIKGTFHQLGSFLSKTNQPDFLSTIHKAAGTLACLPIHAACVTGFYR